MIILLWHNNRALETCVLHVAIAHIPNTDLISFKWNYAGNSFNVRPSLKRKFNNNWTTYSVNFPHTLKIIYSAHYQNRFETSCKRSIWQNVTICERSIKRKTSKLSRCQRMHPYCRHNTHTHTMCEALWFWCLGRRRPPSANHAICYNILWLVYIPFNDEFNFLTKCHAK